MPTPNGTQWRRCRARMDITSDQAAQLLGITGGALRQIETNTKPASLALAFRASRLFRCPVDDLLVDGGEKPDPKPEPKKEPKIEPTAPKPRPDRDRKGPPRTDLAVGAA